MISSQLLALLSGIVAISWLGQVEAAPKWKVEATGQDISKRDNYLASQITANMVKVYIETIGKQADYWCEDQTKTHASWIETPTAKAQMKINKDTFAGPASDYCKEASTITNVIKLVETASDAWKNLQAQFVVHLWHESDENRRALFHGSNGAKEALCVIVNKLIRELCAGVTFTPKQVAELNKIATKQIAAINWDKNKLFAI